MTSSAGSSTKGDLDFEGYSQSVFCGSEHFVHLADGPDVEMDVHPICSESGNSFLERGAAKIVDDAEPFLIMGASRSLRAVEMISEQMLERGYFAWLVKPSSACRGWP